MPAIKKAEALERMKHTPKDRAYYEKELPRHIADFYYTNFKCESVEDIAKQSQNSWVACCEFLRRQCINKVDLCEIKELRLCNNGITHNESYSPELVQVLADVYIELCFLYDKTPSIYGFSVLSGIDRELMHVWIGSGRVSMAYSQNTPKRAIRNIAEARAESLQNIAISGGKGTVGSIAVLNNTTWKNDTVEASAERSELSLDQIPRLPVFHSDGFIENADLLGVPSTSNLENIPKLGNMNLEKW